MNSLLNWVLDIIEDLEPSPLLPLGIALAAAGLALSLMMPTLEAAPGNLTPTPPLQFLIVQSPTPDPAVLRLPRAVVAYASPGGAALGALEAGRSYTPLARSGAEWVLVDAPGSGRVWLAAVELTGAPAVLIDLATPVPAPAPQVVIIERPAPVQAPPVEYVQAPPVEYVQAAQAAQAQIEAAALQARAELEEHSRALQPTPTTAPAMPSGWHPPMAPDYVPTETPAWHAPMALP